MSTIRETDRAPGPLVRTDTLPHGLPKIASETATLYLRQIKRLSRQPMIIAFSLIQPMIWLVLFGQMFSRITQFPGAAQQFGNVSYLQFFVPAVMLQSILFGAGQSGVGIIADMDSGFLDKLLTTPITRLAILLGRVLGDLTRMFVQSLVIVIVAFVVGRFQDPPISFQFGIPGVLGAVLIALLFGLTLAGLNVFIALSTRSTESTFLIGNFLTLPLLFVSSAQLPLTLMPEWMQHIARVNPVTYTVNGMRVLLNGPAAVPGQDPGRMVLEALIILFALAAITVTLATSRFRRTVA
jgi:ABC-2 type transport system permease protein